jgi:hypothetical protein
MLSAGFEPAIPAIKRLQTHVLDLAATEISTLHVMQSYCKICGAFVDTCTLLSLNILLSVLLVSYFYSCVAVLQFLLYV